MKYRNLFITLLLLISLFIYLFFRTEKTIVNEIVATLIQTKNYQAARLWINQIITFPDFIVYSVPEGNWVFCLTVLSGDISIELGKHSLRGVYLPIIYALGLEGFQFLHITNGTYDIADIFFAILFWFLGYQFIGKKSPKFIIKHYRHQIIFIISFALVILSDVWE